MWAVWQNGLQVFVCVLALRKLCVLIGIDCGLPVDQIRDSKMLIIMPGIISVRVASGSCLRMRMRS